MGAVNRLDHLAVVLDAIPSAVVTFDGRLRLTYGNRAVAAVLDVPADLRRNCRRFTDLMRVSAALDGDSIKAACDAAAAALAHPAPERSDLLTLSGAGSRSITLRIARIAGGECLATFEDVTDAGRAQSQAIALATRDPLTELANRSMLMDRLTRLLHGRAHERQACALMLIDLDRFKSVNDTLGHPIGDALLKLVAKRLGGAIRKEELVARLGGDEFALLLHPGGEPGRLAALARRLVDLVGRPYLIDGHLVHIGASIGVACPPQDGEDPDQIFRSADLALYQSKNNGRNTFSFFEPGMDARAHARRAMEIDLRKAVALREFELHYQPQIDLEQDRIVGFEALIRWRHPTRGLVPPDQFIPLTEEIGLIDAVGEWVLREACREAARWPDHLVVAVNVSPRQFEHPAKLLAAVRQALALSGLPGDRLEIEITEGVILRNESTVRGVLHELHDIGVKIAMDDFGTGYSSLSQLHNFPFDKIKIDKSLLQGRPNGTDPNAVIRAITAMGSSLGMLTIAEGVETVEQLANMRSVGCTSVQGYLFSRPVPVAGIDGIIAKFADAKSRRDAA